MKTQREIKFRAYSFDNKQMVYQNNLGFFECLFKWKNNNQTCQLNVALKEPTVNVMQYTGLKDKNGRADIYEGDILKVTNPDFDDLVDDVLFEDGGFIIKIDHPDYDVTTIGWAINIWNIEGSHYEVIGNIHQNPELI